MGEFFKESTDRLTENVQEFISDKLVKMVLISYPDIVIINKQKVHGYKDGKSYGLYFSINKKKYLAAVRSNHDFHLYEVNKKHGIENYIPCEIKNQEKILKLTKKLEEQITKQIIKMSEKICKNL